MSRYTFILNTFGLAYVKPKLFDQIEPGTPDDPIGTSALGTPVFDNVVLQDARVNPEISLKIDTVLIDATLPKRIKKTVVQGRPGTVKEYITLDDWQLSIKGMLVSGVQDKFPIEDLQKLKALCLLEKEIPIVSGYLQELGVFDIVIENAKFPQREGFRSMQLFELICTSDTPIELQLNESTDE